MSHPGTGASTAPRRTALRDRILAEVREAWKGREIRPDDHAAAAEIVTSLSAWMLTRDGLNATLDLYRSVDLINAVGACPIDIRREALEELRDVFDRFRRADVKRIDFASPLLRLARAVDRRQQLGRNLYVTTSDGSTFAGDNWIWFRFWALREALRGEAVSLVLRRFEKLRDPGSGLPLKTVCGVFAAPEGIVPISGDDMRRSHMTDAVTGKPLPKEPSLVFKDFIDIFPEEEWSDG
ncbi:hypothetical protein [Defluviimonas salinarum]|uniref:PAS domain-containing protein n=1 Tax=Defluviimonas salinarum TaxID=2992147 RepID=A0ABT3J666_9RHOB|nr:hypothetical protein [Defluviimonas salinarum]MCW3782950.1 hypothetical protein [Defluviimonas salinarum]